MPIEEEDRATYSTADMVGCVLPAILYAIDEVDALVDLINARIATEPELTADNADTVAYQKIEQIISTDALLDEIIDSIDDYEKEIFQKIKALDAEVKAKTNNFLTWFSNLSDLDAGDLINLELPAGDGDPYIRMARDLIGMPTAVRSEIARAFSDFIAPEPSAPMTYGFDRSTYTSATYSGIRPYDFVDHAVYGVVWEGIDPTTADQADFDKVAERKEVLDMLQMGTITLTGSLYSLKEDEALKVAVIDKIKDDAKQILKENTSLPKQDAMHLALKISVQLGTVPKAKLTR